MLSISGSLRIFIATSPVDCRKSHDGLAALVEQVMIEKPLSGNLFVFTNKRADRIKLLYWDSDGYAVWYTRLEKGTFRLPKAAENATRIEISAVDLSMILSGIDLANIKRQKRFQKPAEIAK
jgi:transposase